jgi:hypothetical protein
VLATVRFKPRASAPILLAKLAVGIQVGSVGVAEPGDLMLMYGSKTIEAPCWPALLRGERTAELRRRRRVLSQLEISFPLWRDCDHLSNVRRFRQRCVPPDEARRETVGGS